MPCDTQCFWLQACENLPVSREHGGGDVQQSAEQREARQDEEHHKPVRHGRREDHEQIYSTILPWQTRILSLQPGHNQLQADLVTVNLQALEGVTIDSTTETIGYRALSYVWGPTAVDHHRPTLICNGSTLTISPNLAQALHALRHPTEVVHLWADAICINQNDEVEKAQQVATMLTIYKKAQSVCAWLGESDQKTPLAFTYLRDSARMELKLQSDDKTISHSKECLDRLHVIYSSLMELYMRPYLKRQWIRQEIYAARQAVVRCGKYEIPWGDYIRAALHTQAMRQLLLKTHNVPLSRQSRLDSLVEEAHANSVIPIGGVKPYREFGEVLSRSAYFDVTNIRDTIYAVLGMCGVRAVTVHLEADKNAIVVDYSKSLVIIYLDTTQYLVKQKKLDDLARAWNFYKPSSLHSQGLPSWAVDWRSGLLKETYVPARAEDIWIPLRTDQGASSKDHKPPEPGLDWLWPEPCPSTPDVLILKARAVNYVAFVSDHTCSPREFLRLHASYNTVLGFAGQLVHARSKPHKSAHIFQLIPSSWTKFKQNHDDWRIAVLGLGFGVQMVLVPAATQKGDLVVTATPELLPNIIHPMQADAGTACGLFEPRDAYEAVVTPRSRLAAILRAVAAATSGLVVEDVPPWATLLEFFYTAVRVSACICAILAVVSVKGEFDELYDANDDDYGHDGPEHTEDRVDAAFRVLCIIHVITTVRWLVGLCLWDHLLCNLGTAAWGILIGVSLLFDLIGIIPGGILLHALYPLMSQEIDFGIGSLSSPSVDMIYATLYVVSSGVTICSLWAISALKDWRFSFRSAHQQKVLGKLDNAIQTMGEHWRFCGPLVGPEPGEKQNIWARPIQEFRLH
nr:heterokaryon incompatibility protein 6, or allele [Quercus suber]